MAARSGQITVTTAGTAVKGTFSTAKVVAVKAHPDNADTVWVGNDDAGDVTASNGFPLDPGEGPVASLLAELLVLTGGLSDVWFDADANGDKICWLVVEW